MKLQSFSLQTRKICSNFSFTFSSQYRFMLKMLIIIMFYITKNKISNILCILFSLEIVGTRDYRKPEWVSQMEEMKEALEGKSLIIYYNFNYYFKRKIKFAVSSHTKTQNDRYNQRKYFKTIMIYR